MSDYSRTFLWGLLWGTMSEIVGVEKITPLGRLILPLTIKEIENAKPMAKKYKMADGGGLCLLVAPSGAKLWVWRYRFDGAEKNMHFGEYPRVTLKDADSMTVCSRCNIAKRTEEMSKGRCLSVGVAKTSSGTRSLGA